MADAGVAARRACETLIETGHVRVNGRVVDRLPAFVDPAADRIEVDGRLVGKPVRPTYIMLNKPTRVLTQPVAPDDDRPSAIQMIDHPARPRLVPVGGLDFDSSGLLLFTNDGDVVNRLTHARYAQDRVYQVKVKGRPMPQTIAQLAKGVFVYDTEDGSRDGAAFTPMSNQQGAGAKRAMPGARAGRPPERAVGGHGMPGKENPRFAKGRPTNARKVQMTIRVTGFSEGNCTLEVIARHARDEEIAKALALAGHPARRVHRVSIGPLVLRELAMGHWRELNKSEIHAITKRTEQERKRKGPMPKKGMGPAEVGRPDDQGFEPAPKPVVRKPRPRPRVIGGGGPENEG